MMLSLALKNFIEFFWNVEDRVIYDGFRPEDAQKDFCTSDYLFELHTEQTMCEWYRWVTEHKNDEVEQLRALVAQSILIDEELAELTYQFRRVYLHLDEYRKVFERIDPEKVKKICDETKNLKIRDNRDYQDENRVEFLDDYDGQSLRRRRNRYSRWSMNELRRRDSRFYQQLKEWKDFLAYKKKSSQEDDEKVLNFLNVDMRDWHRMFGVGNYHGLFCLRTCNLPDLINPTLESFNKRFDSLREIQKKFFECDVIKLLKDLKTVKQGDIQKNYDELIKKMHEIAEAKPFYKSSGRGCVAVLMANGEKYFALSGIDVDLQSLLPLKQDLPSLEPDVEKVGKELDGYNGYKYVHLTPQVERYVELADIEDKNSECTFLSAPTTLANDRLNPIHRRYYTCCERKLMAQVSSLKNVFFIKFKPCIMCLPAVATSLKKRVVSYVYSKESGMYGKSRVVKKIIVKKKQNEYQVHESFGIPL